MFDLTLDLHRFDGEGAAPAEASAEATESGTQEQGTAAEQVSAEDRNAEFERFIGEYRDLYDERMKNAVNTRLKSFKGIENKLKAEQEKTKSYEPILQLLSERYGSDDLSTIAKKLSEDDAYLEEEADKLGVSKEQLRYTKHLERERNMLAKREQELVQREEFQSKVSKWAQQAEAAKAMYPNIDFRAELENEAMFDLLNSGVDFKAAYQVVHMDDIMSGVMQYTAQQVKEKTVNDIRARGTRPAENGGGKSGAAAVKPNIEGMSLKEINDVIKRAARGERIDFK